MVCLIERNGRNLRPNFKLRPSQTTFQHVRYFVTFIQVRAQILTEPITSKAFQKNELKERYDIRCALADPFSWSFPKTKRLKFRSTFVKYWFQVYSCLCTSNSSVKLLYTYAGSRKGAMVNLGNVVLQHPKVHNFFREY